MFPCTWAFNYRAFLACFIFAVTVFGQPAALTYDPSPFNFIGTIDDLTLDTAGGVLAGGTITVNGITVTVPKNLLVTLPSVSVAWSELFDGGVPSLPLLGSVSWEATIFGNVVRGERIAGLIYIAQETTQLLQGFITSINMTTGHFHVSDLDCVLNDPLGRFGPAYTAHPLWTVDPDNPSVRSSTGFPLCIPRNSTDPECPLTNRPTDGNGNALTTFTFNDPASISAGDPDPRIMVPLVVGDYITFSGTKVAGGLLAVYSLEANLGIYTAPGTKPAYITVEAAQYAIVVPDPTVEVGETRATALATDPSTLIQWFAIDVNPCTGKSTERNLLLVKPRTAAPRGKTVFRLSKTDASPATRQVGFRYSTGTQPGPRGIIAGQFIQPVFDYVFPELVSFGSPEVPNQFDLMPYLASGSGPFVPGNLLSPPMASPTIVRQLSPWPGNLKPGAVACPTITPTSSSASSASATGSTTESAEPSASATVSSPAPSASAGGPQVIQILAATTQNVRGTITTSVNATTSSLTAQLFLAIAGGDAVSPQPMSNLGGGLFTMSITTKTKPTSVTVTSSEDATPVTQTL
ncbi:hypothetical protein B0H15DRAFT_857498 [Mycena belliarum]|uniref:Uncharacterized protein n=1 Tax=Mycena belliarum TaxID=1033014 RepID=A0AAD6TUC4_9AGAR|nr:hypothetical protein B0H15DRAFT_857498 [Mycena belliae]